MVITIVRDGTPFEFDNPHEALIFASWEYELNPTAETRAIKESLLGMIRQGVDLNQEIWYNIDVIRKEDKLCQ
jgi:hypothetical protein